MNIATNLRSYSALELINTPFEPREDILEPWLRAEESALLWAAAGIGKTQLALSLALAVAGGGTVGDWRAPVARPVIYIDGEMHQGDLKDRIAHLLDSGAVQVTDREATLANLKIFARQAQDTGTEFFDLTDKDHRAGIVDLVRDKAEMVILDNLTTMTDGLENENDATQFKRLQALFMELKRLGVATILVHHSKKDGQQFRGSSALEATFEVTLALKRVDLAPPGRATFRTEFGKFRAKGDMRLESRTWTLTDEGWVITDAEPEVPEDDPILKALKSLEFVNQTEIAARLNLNKATVSKRLSKLKAMTLLSDEDLKDWFAKAERYRREQASAAFIDLIDTADETF